MCLHPDVEKTAWEIDTKLCSSTDVVEWTSVLCDILRKFQNGRNYTMTIISLIQDDKPRNLQTWSGPQDRKAHCCD